MTGPTVLSDQVLAAFRHVHQAVFAGDPAANPALALAVTGMLMAADTPTIVRLTPWTLNGLALPPDRQLPAEALWLALGMAGPWRDLISTLRCTEAVTSPARRRLLDPRQWGSP